MYCSNVCKCAKRIVLHPCHVREVTDKVKTAGFSPNHVQHQNVSWKSLLLVMSSSHYNDYILQSDHPGKLNDRTAYTSPCAACMRRMTIILKCMHAWLVKPQPHVATRPTGQAMIWPDHFNPEFEPGNY